MSILVEQVLSKIDRLSLAEQLQVLEHLSKQLNQSINVETVHLLKSPTNAAHLERSIAQFKQGKVVERCLLND